MKKSDRKNKKKTVNGGELNPQSSDNLKQPIPTADNPEDLTGHLTELRSRIINCLVFFCIILAATLYFSDIIMAFFGKRVSGVLNGEKLVFISPAEAFFVSIQMSLYSALIISAPYILYQFWAFVYIALDEKEKKNFRSILIFSTLCFYAGCAFAVFVAIPVGIGFLIGYSGAIFKPMISVSAYFDFLVYTSLTFGIVFELPLLMVFLSLVGAVAPKTYSTGRKYAILLIFIIAGVFSPPDVISQFIVAIPMMFLYETGIIIIKLSGIKA